VRRDGRPLRSAAVALAAIVLVAGAVGVASQVRAPAGADREGDRCRRPYTDASPWNARIPPSSEPDPEPWRPMPVLEESITSDPTQFTYPVYEVSASTPRVRVRVTGRWSDVTHGGERLRIEDQGTAELPLPDGVEPAAGADGQIILLDRRTGDEWGAWQLRREGDGWAISGGYHYNTRWSGVPPRDPNGLPFGSRGAGVTYLAGLVRPCEIARGRIDHALAFAYDSPTAGYVHPATKSDGRSRDPADVPEGTRIQLDPAIEGEDLVAAGCQGTCLVLARALQDYGMYVVDNGGRPKLLVEYAGTADWGKRLGEKTPSAIPLDGLRVVAPPPPGG
jgi:hypothetical protein